MSRSFVSLGYSSLFRIRSAIRASTASPDTPVHPSWKHLQMSCIFISTHYEYLPNESRPWQNNNPPNLSVLRRRLGSPQYSLLIRSLRLSLLNPYITGYTRPPHNRPVDLSVSPSTCPHPIICHPAHRPLLGGCNLVRKHLPMAMRQQVCPLGSRLLSPAIRDDQTFS